jgi:hypothetical protein
MDRAKTTTAPPRISRDFTVTLLVFTAICGADPVPLQMRLKVTISNEVFAIPRL